MLQLRMSAQLLRPFLWSEKSSRLIPSRLVLISPSLLSMRQFIILTGLHGSLLTSLSISTSSLSVLMMLVSVNYFLQPQIVAHLLWLFHPPSPTMGTGFQLCLHPLSYYTCRTESFDHAYNIGWGFQSTQRMVTAQFVFIQQTVWEIIWWAAVGPTTGLLTIITSATPSSLLLNQLLWLPEGRCLPSLIPGSQNRPADIYLSNWSRGKPNASPPCSHLL